MIDELSIIIPTLNEEKYLPKLLDSLLLQKYPEKLQVIVSDGQSTDHTIAVAQTYKKKLQDLEIIQGKRGISIQRNAGTAIAKYPYLLFLDADMRLSKTFLKDALQKLPAESDFVGSSIPWPTSKHVFDYVIIAFVRLFVILLSSIDTIVTGENLFTTKHNHAAIGGFNNAIFYGEDIDYGWRSAKKGTKYCLLLTPTIFHSVRRARQMGMFRLLWTWLKGYISIKIFGPYKDKTKLHYPYGHYQKYVD